MSARTGSYRMPEGWHPTRPTIPGCAPTAYSLGDRDRMLIQLWRQRTGARSASAALREMIEVAHAAVRARTNPEPDHD